MTKKELERINDGYNEIINSFISRYAIDNKPIEVSFREMLPEIKSIDRYTHLIHTYPAKLLVHIPYFFLNNTVLSKKGDKVLDPFNGSGTVLLEAILAGRNAYGADANPLARLIAEVKTSKVDIDKLKFATKQIIAKAKKYKRAIIPEVVNCEYWFPKSTIEALAKISTAINKLEDTSIKNFLLVSFSNCVKKVSYADQRISVPVKLNPNRFEKATVQHRKIKERIKSLESLNVYDKFQSVVEDNIKRIESFLDLDITHTAKIIASDARKLTESLSSSRKFKDNSIQLIITSPPYAGAQKYIRASSLNLGWTKLARIDELLKLDKKNIGRESYTKAEIKITPTGIKEADKLITDVFKLNPDRANIVCTYLHEMKHSIEEMIRVLKKNGHLVLIVGNNKVCNKEFNTQEYLTTYLLSKGLQLQFKLIDDIKSYGLMTKRNKTADIISREWILVFKK